VVRYWPKRLKLHSRGGAVLGFSSEAVRSRRAQSKSNRVRATNTINLSFSDAFPDVGTDDGRWEVASATYGGGWARPDTGCADKFGVKEAWNTRSFQCDLRLPLDFSVVCLGTLPKKSENMNANCCTEQEAVVIGIAGTPALIGVSIGSIANDSPAINGRLSL